MKTKLENLITYCKAARRATSLGLCKLLIRDEIQPRIEELLSQQEAQNHFAFVAGHMASIARKSGFIANKNLLNDSSNDSGKSNTKS